MVNRITSKDMLIEIIPGGKVQIHTEVLNFVNVSGGTFRIFVNGYATGNITYNATVATLITNINSALNALTAVLASGEIVATGTLVSSITLTSNTSKAFKLHVDGANLTGTNAEVRQQTTQQGGQVIDLTAFVSTFSWEESVETTSVTAINEFQETSLATLQTMTFELGMYEAIGNSGFVLESGLEALVTVYYQGKVAGKKYCSFNALLTSVSREFPDHDKVELSLSGSRQGRMVVPFDSIYA